MNQGSGVKLVGLCQHVRPDRARASGGVGGLVVVGGLVLRSAELLRSSFAKRVPDPRYARPMNRAQGCAPFRTIGPCGG